MKSNLTAAAGGAPLRSEPPNTSDLPKEVIQAMAHDWGVLVDAYLVNAARIGNRYAATVFCDQSGTLLDGMTVATRSVRQIAARGSHILLQTVDGKDHYVVVTEQRVGGRTHGYDS